MWHKIQITDWKQFNEIALELKPKKWIFRGQSDINWKLETSFYRAIMYVRDLKKTAKQRNSNRDGYEKEIINLFKSQYHLYLTINPDDNADFIIELTRNDEKDNVERKIEWLSLMQHYGVPTRLLDWTFSPYIALFFALENANSDCCIYALNQEEVQSLDKSTFGIGYKNEIFKNRKKDKSFIWPYEPRFKNERLVRQQGLFLVPSSNFETIDEILEQYGDLEKNAIKLIIPENLRFNLLLMLKRLNITHETIFPGIEGFCRSLKFSLLETSKNVQRLK